MIKLGYHREPLKFPAGIPIGGYGLRTELSKGQKGELFVKSLYLQKKKTKCILISIDIHGIEKEFSVYLRRKISEIIGLPYKNVFICPTHTHSGAALLNRSYNLIDIPKNVFKEVEYKILKSCKKAFQNSSNCDSWYNEVTLTPICFHRRKKEIISVKVLCIYFKKEKLIVLIIPIRPVTLTYKNLFLSGDYPYYLGKLFKKRKIELLFLYGAGADVDPYLRGGFQESRKFAQELFEAIQKTRFKELKIENIKIKSFKVFLPFSKIKNNVNINKRELKKAEEEKDYKKIFYLKEKIKISEILRKKGIKTEITILQLGELKLVFTPLDVFYEIEEKLKSLNRDKLKIISITNGHFGYIEPTDVIPSDKPRKSWSLLDRKAGKILMEEILSNL